MAEEKFALTIGGKVTFWEKVQIGNGRPDLLVAREATYVADSDPICSVCRERAGLHTLMPDGSRVEPVTTDRIELRRAQRRQHAFDPVFGLTLDVVFAAMYPGEPTTEFAIRQRRQIFEGEPVEVQRRLNVQRGHEANCWTETSEDKG